MLSRLRIPIWMPVAIIVTLVLGLAAEPFIKANATEEQLAQNVLLSAIPFVLVFVSILLTFILLIVIVARQLNGNIPLRYYRPIEWVIIGGIVLGIFGMFQPWIFGLFKAGFLLLLISTLSFVLWSHVTPRAKHDQGSQGM